MNAAIQTDTSSRAEEVPRHVGPTAVTSRHHRGPLIRQDRISVFEEDCRLLLGDRSYSVMDFSPFGLGVYTPTSIDLPGEVHGVPFLFEGQEIARLSLRKVREERQPDAGFKVGFAITGEPLSLEKVIGLRNARALISSLRQEEEARGRVPAAFRQLTLEIRELLEQVENRVQELEARVTNEYIYADEQEMLEATVVPIVGEHIRDLMENRVGLLAGSLQGADPADVRASYEYFRARLGPLIYQSPFSKRSFIKPLGYAGDYEMMNMIYQGDAIGGSLFSRCLNHYIVNMPGGQAVRNRACYLNEKLRGMLRHVPLGVTRKFLSVASGPAMEVQMLFSAEQNADTSRGEFHLLDQDIHSLKHAQRRLRELSQRAGRPCHVKLFHNHIKKVINEGLEEEGYDLIYTAGLFDYFSDPVAFLAARRLFAGLRPGGRLIIGNFNVTSPSRFFMEMAWEWNLVYRSVEDMERLGRSLGGRVTVEQEEQGINLFCVVER